MATLAEGILLFAAICYVAIEALQWIILKRRLGRWRTTRKDVVILHGFARLETIPCGSPFVLKVETFLRMANIPYKYDPIDSFGPNGKTPWVTLNGQHFTDSQLIIEHLKKKFNVDLNGKYSEEKLAVGHAARILLEEHVFWGMVRLIFVDGPSSAIKHFKIPFNIPRWFVMPIARRSYRNYLWAQGFGRFSAEEAQLLMRKDVESFATILGNNKFLLGDEPSEVDASAFGFITQITCGLVSDRVEFSSLLREHPNLSGYCSRMKEKFWPDWEKCLAQ